MFIAVGIQTTHQLLRSEMCKLDGSFRRHISLLRSFSGNILEQVAINISSLRDEARRQFSNTEARLSRRNKNLVAERRS